MGSDTEISWADDTFNCWWGCERVSPACDHCYAESLATRFGHEIWGGDTPRRFFGDKHWGEPVKWNREAETWDRPRRVFCASMADVFEDRRDLDDWRLRLWQLIRDTPNLEWLLLTKRPQHIVDMVDARGLPANARLGTTAEDQAHTNVRTPRLLAAHAQVGDLRAMLAITAHAWMATLSAECFTCYQRISRR